MRCDAGKKWRWTRFAVNCKYNKIRLFPCYMLKVKIKTSMFEVEIHSKLGVNVGGIVKKWFYFNFDRRFEFVSKKLTIADPVLIQKLSETHFGKRRYRDLMEMTQFFKANSNPASKLKQSFFNKFYPIFDRISARDSRRYIWTTNLKP